MRKVLVYGPTDAPVATSGTARPERNSFAEMVIWQLPQPLPGSSHRFKYRLAFVVDELCVLRFDNEAGKGDHKHVGEEEVEYRFRSLSQLVADFWSEIERWRTE